MSISSAFKPKQNPKSIGLIQGPKHLPRLTSPEKVDTEMRRMTLVPVLMKECRDTKWARGNLWEHLSDPVQLFTLFFSAALVLMEAFGKGRNRNSLLTG